MERKLTPAQRSLLKLQIGRTMEKYPEFALKVMNRNKGSEDPTQEKK